MVLKKVTIIILEKFYYDRISLTIIVILSWTLVFLFSWAFLIDFSFFMPHLSHRKAVCQWYETQVHRDLIIKASQTYMYTTPTATHFEQTVQMNDTGPG